MRGQAPSKARVRVLLGAHTGAVYGARGAQSAARAGREAALLGRERHAPYHGNSQRQTFLRSTWEAAYDLAIATELTA
ncbi:MAG: hypothetical protein JNM58_00635 [Xanthomonadaceae bacterium]|nr:hypothetical protein [Xanthomonadaceae bacterium]